MSIRSERIKQLIEESGKSYIELEKITGIKKSSLQRYASGTTTKIPLDAIEILSNVFNVPQEYLMGWDNMTIGKRIREERLRCSLSQEEVAKALNTTKQAIYKYESDIVTKIPMDKVEKLSLLFGVTPSYLMGWDEQKKPTAISGEISGKRKALIEYALTLSEEEADRALQVLKLIVEAK